MQTPMGAAPVRDRSGRHTRPLEIFSGGSQHPQWGESALIAVKLALPPRVPTAWWPRGSGERNGGPPHPKPQKGEAKELKTLVSGCLAWTALPEPGAETSSK